MRSHFLTDIDRYYIILIIIMLSHFLTDVDHKIIIL